MIASIKPVLIKIAQWLLAAALDKVVRDNLPQIYNEIDGQMPKLLEQGAPPEVVGHAISTAISKATGQPALKDQIDAVVGLYSPIAAAVNSFRR